MSGLCTTGNDSNERLSLNRSNAQRDMSKAEIMQIVAELEDLYNELKPGGRKVEWIAPYIGKVHGLYNLYWIKSTERTVMKRKLQQNLELKVKERG